MIIKILAVIPLVALMTVACQTSRYAEQAYSTSAPTVDKDLFVLVPEANRGDLAETRAELSRVQDGVGLAERDLMVERQRLTGAKQTAEQAGEGMSSARRALVVAKNSGELRRADEIATATAQIDRARARWHEARSQVALHTSRIAQLESDVILAKLRVDLATAKVEFDKARAVTQLDRPEADTIALRDFEASVAECETQIAMAEVDAEAWERKMQLRQKALEASADNRETVRTANE